MPQIERTSQRIPLAHSQLQSSDMGPSPSLANEFLNFDLTISLSVESLVSPACQRGLTHTTPLEETLPCTPSLHSRSESSISWLSLSSPYVINKSTSVNSLSEASLKSPCSRRRASSASTDGAFTSQNVCWSSQDLQIDWPHPPWDTKELPSNVRPKKEGERSVYDVAVDFLLPARLKSLFDAEPSSVEENYFTRKSKRLEDE